MNLRKHVRTLGAAALALAVVGVSAGHVEAKPRWPKDTGVRCVAVYPDGYMDFYLPGQHFYNEEKVAGEDKLVERECGRDGLWRVIEVWD